MVEHSVSELYLVREREEEEVYVFVTLLDLRGRIFDRISTLGFDKAKGFAFFSKIESLTLRESEREIHVHVTKNLSNSSNLHRVFQPTFDIVDVPLTTVRPSLI